MQKIEKLAINKDDYRRKLYYFDRARDGFRAIIDREMQKDTFVFLPSFIGWSSREGSGVFDPVVESGANYLFYKLNASLHIDIDDLRAKLLNHKIGIFVMIHYFGHIDPNYLEIIKLIRTHGGIILEDEAHAFFTDFVDGSTGRKGDYAIFSLHKMFPEANGGALLVNNPDIQFDNTHHSYDILSYDLHSIAKIRKSNASYLEYALQHVHGVRPLWQTCVTETWQTFPIVIEFGDRDKLYLDMNNAGFGVVSLYHTLIPQIDVSEFGESYKLSKQIMNLPIHQDVTTDQIDEMLKCLISLLSQK